MVEPPRSEVEYHRYRLICYSRLCLNIGKELMTRSRQAYNKALYPSKTHQLIVGRFGILSSDSEGSQETLNLISSLSSSLPHDAKARKDSSRQTLKTTAIQERGATLRQLDEQYVRVAAHMQPGAQTSPAGNPFGGCAEAPNIAMSVTSECSQMASNCLLSSSCSHHVTDQHTCALGQAIDVVKLDCPFIDFGQHLNEAGVDPCRNCIHLFTHGSVQQFDNGTGLITGPSPQGWILSKPWQNRVCLPVTSFIDCSLMIVNSAT